MSKLQDKKLNEIEEVINRIRYLIAHKKNSDDMIDKVFMATYYQIERQACNGGVNIRGTTAKLWNNDDFLDAWEAVKLEYLNFGTFSPIMRLTLLSISTAMSTYGENAMLNAPTKPTSGNKRQMFTGSQLNKMSSVSDAHKPTTLDDDEELVTKFT